MSGAQIMGEGFSALLLAGRPQRYNAGTMRRYRFTNGTVLVVTSDPVKRACVIPRSCPHVTVPCERGVAARALRWARHNRRNAT